MELPQLVRNAPKHRCQIISGCLVALNNIGKGLVDNEEKPFTTTPL